MFVSKRSLYAWHYDWQLSHSQNLILDSVIVPQCSWPTHLSLSLSLPLHVCVCALTTLCVSEAGLLPSPAYQHLCTWADYLTCGLFDDELSLA